MVPLHHAHLFTWRHRSLGIQLDVPTTDRGRPGEGHGMVADWNYLPLLRGRRVRLWRKLCATLVT